MGLHVELLSRDVLSKAEGRVLSVLCTGKMRQEIANDLCRSYGTVSKHIETISEKLDAHSAAEIVAKAVAKGLVKITFIPCFLVMISMTQADNNAVRLRLPRAPLVRYLAAIREAA